jgi:hypothetical protein
MFNNIKKPKAFIGLCERLDSFHQIINEPFHDPNYNRIPIYYSDFLNIFDKTYINNSELCFQQATKYWGHMNVFFVLTEKDKKLMYGKLVHSKQIEAGDTSSFSRGDLVIEGDISFLK